MAIEREECLMFLHQLIDQIRLVVELFERGIISPSAYQIWLEGHWAVIWEIYSKVKEGK